MTYTIKKFDIKIGALEGFFLYSNIKWSPKALTKISYIILHHTGNKKKSLEQIYFEGIKKTGQPQYHYIINHTGTVFQTLPLSMTGAHTKNYNTTSIGIALLNVSHSRPPSLAMRYSFSELVKHLSIVYRPLKKLTHFQIMLEDINKTADWCGITMPKLDEKYYIKHGGRELSVVNIETFKKYLFEMLDTAQGEQLQKQIVKLSIDNLTNCPGNFSHVLF